jgi:hypothetical protein
VHTHYAFFFALVFVSAPAAAAGKLLIAHEQIDPVTAGMGGEH